VRDASFEGRLLLLAVSPCSASLRISPGGWSLSMAWETRRLARAAGRDLLLGVFVAAAAGREGSSPASRASPWRIATLERWAKGPLGGMCRPRTSLLGAGVGRNDVGRSTWMARSAHMVSMTAVASPVRVLTRMIHHPSATGRNAQRLAALSRFARSTCHQHACARESCESTAIHNAFRPSRRCLTN